jgi:hypothetical protein
MDFFLFFFGLSFLSFSSLEEEAFFLHSVLCVYTHILSVIEKRSFSHTFRKKKSAF